MYTIAQDATIHFHHFPSHRQEAYDSQAGEADTPAPHAPHGGFLEEIFEISGGEGTDSFAEVM